MPRMKQPPASPKVLSLFPSLFMNDRQRSVAQWERFKGGTYQPHIVGAHLTRPTTSLGLSISLRLSYNGTISRRGTLSLAVAQDYRLWFAHRTSRQVRVRFYIRGTPFPKTTMSPLRAARGPRTPSSVELPIWTIVFNWIGDRDLFIHSTNIMFLRCWGKL